MPTVPRSGDNPMCGDRMELYLKLTPDGAIEDAAFQGRGCAISMASASLMTETVKGKSPAQARRCWRNVPRPWR